MTNTNTKTIHRSTNTITNHDRKLLLFAAAVTVILIAAVLFTTKANAMGDRKPAGSVPMPENNTITVKQGTETKINFGTKYYEKRYYYIKIEPSKTGYIEFTDDFTQGNSITLCNTRKKPISRSSNISDDYYNADSSYRYQEIINYGVKKGKVYYIRIKGSSKERFKDESPYIGTVKWMNRAVKAAKYGKSQKKAPTIKENKKNKGLFKAGSTKAQWFKIKSKKKKTRVYFSSKKINGKLVCEVHYNSMGKWYHIKLHTERSDDKYKNSGVFNPYNSKSNIYYLKIYPEHTTSGAYTVMWK